MDISLDVILGGLVADSGNNSSGTSCEFPLLSGLWYPAAAQVFYKHWLLIHYKLLMRTGSPSYVCPQRLT